MKDAARLIVGIVLLGLATYLSLQYPSRNPSNTATELVGNRTSQKSSTADRNTQHESEPPARNASQVVGREIVKPDFESPPPGLILETPAEAEFDSLQSPPRIADEYQPLVPLRPDVEIEIEGPKLVPVQPKTRLTSQASQYLEHTIRDGDTLQSISQEYYGSANDYLEIYSVNRGILSEPGVLPVGKTIKIPRR